MTETTDGLNRYEDRTSVLMLALSLVFLALYAVPILDPEAPSGVMAFVDAASIAVWAAFLTDLAVRAYLSGRPGRYLLRNPIDVMLVVLPMLRPLRVLRVFTAANLLVRRGSRLALGRTLSAALVATALLMVVASLSVLDAERYAAGATITTFGDALWWSGVTVTTVGYGDLAPVTGTGRIVAFGLMLVGISVVGLVTASVAGWFVAQTRESEDEILVEVRSLREEVASLRRGHAAEPPEGSDPR